MKKKNSPPFYVKQTAYHFKPETYKRFRELCERYDLAPKAMITLIIQAAYKEFCGDNKI